MINIDEFIQDRAYPKAVPEPARQGGELIAGVSTRPLRVNRDGRGSLIELLTTRDGEIEPIVHVYLVRAAPLSVRAWVIHKYQFDRLAFTTGDFRVVLFDPRPDSPTHGKLNVFDVGLRQPIMLTIPPFVAHGVQNRGDAAATFVNLPTKAWDPADPDKFRVAADHPGIPWRF